MIALRAETWATIGTLLAALVGLYVALRGDIHREVHGLETRLDARIDGLEVRMDRLETRVERLDDRVYALAAGLRPQVEAARADES